MASLRAVSKFLRQHEFEEDVVEVFHKNKISFDVLVDLTPSDMKELGIVLGDRKRLSMLIRQIQENPTLKNDDQYADNEAELEVCHCMIQ